MVFYFGSLCFLAVISTAFAAQNCYYCDSSEVACPNPFEITTALSVQCKDLSDTNQARSRSSDPFPFSYNKNLNMAIKRLKPNVNQTGRSAPPPMDYVCVKAYQVESDKTELIRTCVPKSNTIDDVCAYLLAEDDAIKSCSHCNEDNCNSASSLTYSIIFSMAAGVILKILY